VPVCPVDCIRPVGAAGELLGTEMLYIDPGSCIDCGACFDERPVDADRSFDLGSSRAVIVGNGNGNVALDVARGLMMGSDALAETDAAEHALDALRRCPALPTTRPTVSSPAITAAWSTNRAGRGRLHRRPARLRRRRPGCVAASPPRVKFVAVSEMLSAGLPESFPT
jgi:ferredoxin